MLPEEAAWIDDRLAGLGARSLSPLLNLGSGNQRFRDVEQPFVGKLWRDFEAAGGRIVHADLRDEPGVDLVGDLHDDAFQARLHQLRPAAVVASNLLEHVRDPRAMARLIAAIVPRGSHLVVTGPLVFPHHPDPIDNGLRMTPQEAAAMFPGMTPVAQDVVQSPQYLAQQQAVHRERTAGQRIVRRLWYLKEGVRSRESRRTQWSHWRHKGRVPSAYAVVLRQGA